MTQSIIYSNSMLEEKIVTDDIYETHSILLYEYKSHYAVRQYH